MTDDGKQRHDDQGGTEPHPGGASSRRAPPTIDLKSSDYSAASSSGKGDQAVPPDAGESGMRAENAGAGTVSRANALRQYAIPALAGALAAFIVAALLMMSGAFKNNEPPAQASLPAVPQQSAQDKMALDELGARLARLEKASAAPAMDPLLPARVATLEQSAQSGRETLAALRRQVDSLSSVIVEVKNAASKADAPARADDNEAKAAIPAISENDLVVLRERLAKAEQALDSVMTQVAETKAALPGLVAQGAANSKLQVFAAALALDLRVRSGDAYQRELQELKNEARKISEGAALIRPDDLAALDTFAAKGVPSTRQLADDLSRVLTASAAASADAQKQADTGGPANASIMERLTAHAGKLVKIERVDAGADKANADTSIAQAAMKKALAAAQRGDLAAAQAELGREAGQEIFAQNSAAAEWIASVKARDAARAASDAILVAARAQLSIGR